MKLTLKIAFGIVLSALGIWLVLSKVSLAEIGEAVGRINLWYVPVLMALNVVGLLWRRYRWLVELVAMQPGRYAKTFRAIGLGYFGNLLLPFKAGEIIRVALLKRHNPDVKYGNALATIVGERFIDGTVLFLLLLGFLPFIAVSPDYLNATSYTILGLFLLGAVLLMTPLMDSLLNLLPQKGVLVWAHRFLTAMHAGTAALRRKKTFLKVVLLTEVIWLSEGVILYIAAQSLNLPVNYMESLVIALFMSFGILIPSAPAQIGTHQALMVYFLIPFGIGAAEAVSLSLLMQAVTITVLGTIGVAVLFLEAGGGSLIASTRQIPSKN